MKSAEKRTQRKLKQKYQEIAREISSAASVGRVEAVRAPPQADSTYSIRNTETSWTILHSMYGTVTWFLPVLTSYLKADHAT
jgi:hypothetical protein